MGTIMSRRAANGTTGLAIVIYAGPLKLLNHGHQT
jgi:hypothetical protein